MESGWRFGSRASVPTLEPIAACSAVGEEGWPPPVTGAGTGDHRVSSCCTWAICFRAPGGPGLPVAAEWPEQRSHGDVSTGHGCSSATRPQLRSPGHPAAPGSTPPSYGTCCHPPTLPPSSGHGLLSAHPERAQLEHPSTQEAPRRDGVMALGALETDSPFKEKGKALCAGTVLVLSWDTLP